MSLDTGIQHEFPGNGKQNGKMKKIKEFKYLVEQGQKSKAWRMYREEFSPEEKEEMKKKYPGYVKAARISGF